MNENKALTNKKRISNHSRAAEARAVVKPQFGGLAQEILKAAMPQKKFWILQYETNNPRLNVNTAISMEKPGS